MSELQSTDVQRLQAALQLPSAFQYRDFSEQAAVSAALQRWPLVAQLLYARQMRQPAADS